jgi:hypothetical protein
MGDMFPDGWKRIDFWKTERIAVNNILIQYKDNVIMNIIFELFFYCIIDVVCYWE